MSILSMLDPRPLAIAGALGAALGTAGGWWLTRNHYVAQIAGIRAEQQAQIDAADAKQRRAAADYEKLRSQRAARAPIIQQEVRRATDAHRGWSDQPIPDGVRHAAERAAAELAGVADRAVPGAGASRAGDER